MTVASEINHNQYVGNGVTTAFDYGFRVFKNSHLLVQVSDLDGVLSTLVLGTDYTVTGVGASGGKVLLTVPLAIGWSISIDRSLPIVQETDLRNQGTFYAETHEDAFDYLTMLIQRVYSYFNLALRKPSWLAKFYDAQGNRISNLANPVNPQDAVTKNYSDNQAQTNLNKTLRVPDAYIEQLPTIAQLEGKVIAIVNGKPVGVLPQSGSATDVLIELSKPAGFKNIGQVKYFSLLRSIIPESEGQRILLASYYEGGRTGGGEFIARGTAGLATIPADNGGSIASVNATWFWERVQQDNSFVEDFGAVPFAIAADNTIPSSAVSSSDAFQRMFNALNYIQMTHSARYLITTPVKLKGNYWRIIGNKSFIHKKSVEKTGLTSPIPVFGGYASIDYNCVFVAIEDCRYWTIEGFDIDCHEGILADRPVGFYFPSVVNYAFSKINTRGCMTSFWFKNAWQGKFDDVRTNEDILDGWFYDDSRLNSSGVNVGVTSQSATSVVFNKCYANAPGRYGFNIRDADYMSMVNGACDYSGSASYRFHKVNIDGNCSAESTLGEYFNISGEGVIDIYASLYDNLADNGQFAVTVAGNSNVNMTVRGRTGKANRFNVTASGAEVVVSGNWYNGVDTGLGVSNCISGSILKIGIGRGAGASRIWSNGVAQEVRESSPSYSSTVATLTPYAAKEARFGIAAATSTVVIPMYRFKEIFPNFNRPNNLFAEWLQIRTTNGPGITYGAAFFCFNNTATAKTTGQSSFGTGSAEAVVSSITADSTNLTIVFAGTIASGSVISFQPV